MRRLIPAPVIAVIAEVLCECETHATVDNLFMYAGAPGDAPPGSRLVKTQAWLRRVNEGPTGDPLKVLGRIIEGYMEMPDDPLSPWRDDIQKRKDRLARVLAECELQYVKGGTVVGALGAPSRSLQSQIRERNLASVEHEFDRALQSVTAAPREAVSAACNILESVCKVYIEEEGLEMPAKQDLQGVWNVVRKHLGFDPSQIADQDLKEILSGLLSVVHGIGALRTHASSAHGAGKKSYRLEGRHARLSVHAAHTVALFVLESWDSRGNR